MQPVNSETSLQSRVGSRAEPGGAVQPFVICAAVSAVLCAAVLCAAVLCAAVLCAVTLQVCQVVQLSASVSATFVLPGLTQQHRL